MKFVVSSSVARIFRMKNNYVKASVNRRTHDIPALSSSQNSFHPALISTHPPICFPPLGWSTQKTDIQAQATEGKCGMLFCGMLSLLCWFQNCYINFGILQTWAKHFCFFLGFAYSLVDFLNLVKMKRFQAWRNSLPFLSHFNIYKVSTSSNNLLHCSVFFSPMHLCSKGTLFFFI